MVAYVSYFAQKIVPFMLERVLRTAQECYLARSRGKTTV